MLDATERLAMLNWQLGFFIYDFQPIITHNAAVTPIIYGKGGNALCNQGLASIDGGRYIASVMDRDIIQLWKARDGLSAGLLKISGLLTDLSFDKFPLTIH